MKNLFPPKLTKWLAENKAQILFGIIFILASSGLIYAKQNHPQNNSDPASMSDESFSALEKISQENTQLKEKISSLESQLFQLEQKFSKSQEFYKQDMEKVNNAFNTVASNINKVASAKIAGVSTSGVNSLTGLSGITPASGQTKGLININTASSTLLQQLPGIGPAKAKDIIDYRATIGKFTSKTQLKQVKGIGNATYEKLEDLITI